MSEEGTKMKDLLLATKAKVTKVAADVLRLHTKIDALGSAPTPEEIAEIKAMSGEINDSLQAVDDSTPEEEEPEA